MVKTLNSCIDFHNPTDTERRVFEVLIHSADMEELGWTIGAIDRSFTQLAKEAGVSLGQLIRALFFWQSVALISMDVGREEADGIVIFCHPLVFIKATKICKSYNDCSAPLDGPSWKQGCLFMDLDSGITCYRP